MVSVYPHRILTKTAHCRVSCRLEYGLVYSVYDSCLDTQNVVVRFEYISVVSI